MLTVDEESVKRAIESASPTEKIALLKLLSELESRKKRDRAQEHFMEYVEQLWPDFIHGAHHRRMAALFEAVARGEKKRVIINMAPRHTKSKFASFLLPSWILGKFPNKKIMQVSNTAELAEGFGRDVRNLVLSEQYRNIFPDTELRQDSKAAGRWSTNHGGEYYATGVGGALAGRGADLCVHKKTKVFSLLKGITEAENVALGDYLLGSDGYGEVVEVIDSIHKTTVIIDSVRFSEQHPIWTCNRGWVPSIELTTLDLLQTVSVYDRLYALKPIRSVYETCNKATKKLGKILLSYIQHMVRYASKVFKPKCSELQQLWWARNNCMRALEQVRQFLFRYGRTTIGETHLGQTRRKWELLFRKLPMVEYGNAIQQQTKQCCNNSIWGDQNFSAVGESYGVIKGYDKTSDIRNETRTRRSVGDATRELGSKTSIAIYVTERVCPSLRVTRRYGEGYRVEQKSGASVLSRKEQIVLRVLLGVRSSKSIAIEHHSPEQFINFTVSGHNTFIADPYLTHNCIIDDPHSEGEALAAQFNPAIYDKVYEWFTTGPRQRLQPGGAIIIVATRWHMRDLTGQIIDASMSKDGVDQWEVIEFPAILPSGNPLWPEYWKISELEAIRAEIPNLKWQAQYQQQPTSEQAAIIKREWWRMWESDTPPQVEYVIMTMDTAFEAKQTADYSAALMLGVWNNPEDNDQPNIIVLNAWRDRLEFPDLKEKTLEMYKDWQPDSFIIEKKASGAPLIAEIRRIGIPVQEYTPTRGAANSPNNKLARLNAVADIFASGRVWAPSSERWSTALIDEVASFPAGKNDDWVDCLSLGLSRFRQGGFIGTTLDDAVNDGYEYNYRRKAAYY
jgi:predicted phage terminase large subunit-like protein